MTQHHVANHDAANRTRLLACTWLVMPLLQLPRGVSLVADFMVREVLAARGEFAMALACASQSPWDKNDLHGAFADQIDNGRLRWEGLANAGRHMKQGGCICRGQHQIGCCFD